MHTTTKCMHKYNSGHFTLLCMVQCTYTNYCCTGRSWTSHRSTCGQQSHARAIIFRLVYNCTEYGLVYCSRSTSLTLCYSLRSSWILNQWTITSSSCSNLIWTFPAFASFITALSPGSRNSRWKEPCASEKKIWCARLSLFVRTVPHQ